MVRRASGPARRSQGLLSLLADAAADARDLSGGKERSQRAPQAGCTDAPDEPPTPPAAPVAPPAPSVEERVRAGRVPIENAILLGSILGRATPTHASIIAPRDFVALPAPLCTQE